MNLMEKYLLKIRPKKIDIYEKLSDLIVAVFGVSSALLNTSPSSLPKVNSYDILKNGIIKIL